MVCWEHGSLLLSDKYSFFFEFKLFILFLSKKIFEEEKFDKIIFLPYNVFPNGDKTGLIQFINAESIQSILNKQMTIKDYLLKSSSNGEENLKNYFKSCGKNFTRNTSLFSHIILFKKI